jgi:hypothetical protein
MVTVTVQEVESPDAGESSGNDETANADGGWYKPLQEDELFIAVWAAAWAYQMKFKNC